jgi:hypothetical protein
MHTPLKAALRIQLVIALVAAILGGAAITKCIAEEAKPAPTPEQEAKFISTLTNATLKGHWALIKDGQLGQDKEDAYQIVSVKKLEGDRWQINARLQYGGKTLDVPVPAQVKWAGDTAVMLFDGINLGGPRTYSARLMVFDTTYAGSWSGGDHGGMLYGLISHETH